MKHKKTLITTMSTLSIILIIITMTTAYAVINGNDENNRSTSNAEYDMYSWVGYDYNTETWIDMNDVNMKANILFTSLTDKHVDIHDGDISLNDGDYEKYGSEKWVFNDANRFKVNMNNDETSKSVVYMNSIIYDNNMNTCSGSLIAENYVLTAAHCVTQYNDSVNKPCPNGANCVNGEYGDTSRFNERINLYIGRNSGHTDYSYYSAHKVYVPQAWRVDGLIHSKADIALIELNHDADGKYPTDYGARVYGYAWFDKFKYDFKNTNASFIGYPSDKWKTDKNMDTMWLSIGQIDNSNQSFVDANTEYKIMNAIPVYLPYNQQIDDYHNFTYKIDNYQGNSGAGLRYVYDNQYVIIGVNTEERPYSKKINDDSTIKVEGADNIATRITQEYYAWIRTITENQ